MSKIGVIIANTGSPSAPTPEAVRDYLREFLTDPRICPMRPIAWNFILNSFVLPKRSGVSAAKYAAIWRKGGSPLTDTMRALAASLDASCGTAFDVRCAMSYGEPSIPEALLSLRDAGCEELVVIPLYPQSAFSTTSVVRDKVEASLAEADWRPRIRFVDAYSDRDDYLDAIANSVKNTGFEEGDRLLMAFHSIPMRDIARGDNYSLQACNTASEVASRLGLNDGQWVAGFQCRFDKSRKWLGPSTGEAIDSLGDGYGRLFVVAPNFSVDCLETLWDIDFELRRRFEDAHSGTKLVYVPCLNDSQAHIDLLRAIIEAENES